MLETFDDGRNKLDLLAKRLMHSPFYKNKLSPDFSSKIDFYDIPFTTKEDLRQVRGPDLLAVSYREIAHYHESSGTTGQPSVSWYTKKDIRKGGEHIRSSGIGLQEDDLVLIRFPFALFLPAYLVQEAANQAGSGIVPVSSRNTVSTYPKVLRLMMDLGVTVLAGIPREMELLAETSRLLGWDPLQCFPSLRGIVVAGELLSPSRKRHIENLWNVPVYNLYGSTETGNIAAMCRHGVMHMAEDDYLVEVYDDELRHPLPLGEKGQAVITTWTHEGSPLLRYANGDIVSLHQTACLCGSTNKELRHYGRWSERMYMGDQAVDSEDWQELLYQLDPVPLAWHVEEHPGSIRVLLEFPQDTSVSADVVERLLKANFDRNILVHIAAENELLNRADLLQNSGSRKPKYISKASVDERDHAVGRGMENFIRGDFLQAQSHFQNTIQERPDHAEARAWLAATYGKRIEEGNLLTKMELLPLMKKEANRAVELDPTSALARQVKGMVLLRTPVEFGGDPKRAVEELKTSIFLGTKDIQAWVSLAEAYLKINNGLLARNAFERALSINSQDPGVIRLSQILLEEKGVS